MLLVLYMFYCYCKLHSIAFITYKFIIWKSLLGTYIFHGKQFWFFWFSDQTMKHLQTILIKQEKEAEIFNYVHKTWELIYIAQHSSNDFNYND